MTRHVVEALRLLNQSLEESRHPYPMGTIRTWGKRVWAKGVSGWRPMSNVLSRSLVKESSGLSDAQMTALKTLEINGSSTKATSVMRSLVRLGFVDETKRFQNKSIFRLSEKGREALAKGLKETT